MNLSSRMARNPSVKLPAHGSQPSVTPVLKAAFEGEEWCALGDLNPANPLIKSQVLYQLS